jgi:hypothetical protein
MVASDGTGFWGSKMVLGDAPKADPSRGHERGV